MLTPDVLSQIKIARQAVDGEIAYIAFSAGRAIPLISDTFVIRDGKIVAQTTAVQMSQ